MCNNNKFVCEIFIFLSDTEQFVLIIHVKAGLTIICSTNTMLFSVSTNCKYQMNACFKDLVAKDLRYVSVYGSTLQSFISTNIHCC